MINFPAQLLAGWHIRLHIQVELLPKPGVLDQYHGRRDDCSRQCVEVTLCDGEELGRGCSGQVAIAVVAALDLDDCNQLRGLLEL